MSSAANAPSAPVKKKKASPLAITAIVVVALVVIFFAFSGFYTDFLWFQQLGFTSILTTRWLATVGMFLVGFFSMAIPIWLAIQLAYRLRPVYAKLSSQLDRYQELIEPLRKLATIGIPILFGLFAGLASASRWQSVLVWWNSTPSGTLDPQFGLDTSFFMFELPFYRGVIGFASAVFLLATLITVAVSYLYGSLHLSGKELRISKHARIQIAVLAGVYLLLQGVSIWLDQYKTVTETGSLFTGASYTDVNAVIPGRMILAGIALFVALLFFVTAFIGRWRLPIIGTALLLVSGLVIGTGYPWVVQRFQVEPNAKSLETPFLQKNIDMTRDAFGVSDVEEIPYAATTNATQGALREDAATTASIRIIDPAIVSRSVAQLQQFKQYYGFGSVLDVDRYTIDGKSQDTVVAVRELKQSGLDSKSWVNQALVYTHGYGVVAAYGNKRSTEGQPVFFESGIPSSGELGKYEPRIYFGESSPSYSIVGGSSDDIELDYPNTGDDDAQVYNTFDGDGGPKLDNIFTRLVYALKFQSEQIFLSSDVSNESQILYDRDPKTRVQSVAPYLTLDSDPYPTVVDGRVKWVIDGYTTSADYPYSKVVGLSSTIADAKTGAQSFALDNINYMRNSVKATVDAYDGSVTLYAWDEDDTILQTWQKIYPSTVKPMSDMSADLVSHVRYPADLFKVQRSILGEYHVTDAGQFYSQTDRWTTPNDPQTKKGEATRYQSPYYLTMQMPGQDKPSYSLYSSFIPAASGENARNVLTGYLAVDSNAGTEKGKIADDYGKLRMLTLTSEAAVPGPGQVQNKFDSDTVVSKEINLLKQGQTEVLNGNLLTLPVGGGLLYVQPVYVQSSGDTSYPLLRRVLVAFGDKIAFESTLDEALDALFGGDSGASAGDGGTVTTPEPEVTDPDAETPSTETPSDGNTSGDLKSALADAAAAMEAKSAAMESGDWAAYGAADKKLTDAINRANSLLGN